MWWKAFVWYIDTEDAPRTDHAVVIMSDIKHRIEITSVILKFTQLPDFVFCFIAHIVPNIVVEGQVAVPI